MYLWYVYFSLLQASSFFLEDEQRDKSSDTIKKIKEAFSVSYYSMTQSSKHFATIIVVVRRLIMLTGGWLFLQVVGSVLYFTSFCLDKLGQPLLNDNPQLTDGWEVPKYPQGSMPLWHYHWLRCTLFVNSVMSLQAVMIRCCKSQRCIKVSVFHYVLLISFVILYTNYINSTSWITFYQDTHKFLAVWWL